jgi:hypothetical protein
VVTDNYVFPFFHLRHGDGLRGWQFWPIAGSEHKDVTTRTNGFGDVRVIGGHDKRFVLWPFYLEQKLEVGTPSNIWQQVSFPAYGLERSAQRDFTSVLWLFTHVDDHEKKYHEWGMPWPFIEYARGEGKNTTRFWPLFSHAQSPTQESDFYLWPVYLYRHSHGESLDRRRTRIVFFLYSDLVEKNTETGASRRRQDFWPFFTRRQEFDGKTSFQSLALLESFLTGSHKFDRDWSPVWALWRTENDPRACVQTKSLLWDLYRRDTTPGKRKTSILFGLFHFEKEMKKATRP